MVVDSGHIGSCRANAARGRKPGSLGGRKTKDFSSLLAFPRPKRFSRDHSPSKQEVVFSFWE